MKEAFDQISNHWFELSILANQKYISNTESIIKGVSHESIADYTKEESLAIETIIKIAKLVGTISDK